MLHSSGSPALRMPSRMGSSWARYVGSSLIATQKVRAREIVKAGLSGRPARTVERALVRPAELREGGGQREHCGVTSVSVGLDRPPKPRDRLLIAAELVLRDTQQIIQR